MTFKLIRARDQTCLARESGARYLIQKQTKKSQTALKTEPYLHAVITTTKMYNKLRLKQVTKFTTTQNNHVSQTQKYCNSK